MTKLFAPSSPRQQWQLLIGSFILTFGEIEYAVHLMWQQCFGAKPEPQSFTLRIDKLVGRVKDDPALSGALPDLLIEAKEMWDYRRTVAHHPLSLRLHRHEVSRKVTPVLEVSSRTGEVRITEAKLRSLNKQAERLSNQIKSTFLLRDLDR